MFFALESGYQAGVEERCFPCARWGMEDDDAMRKDKRGDLTDFRFSPEEGCSVRLLKRTRTNEGISLRAASHGMHRHAPEAGFHLPAIGGAVGVRRNAATAVGGTMGREAARQSDRQSDGGP